MVHLDAAARALQTFLTTQRWFGAKSRTIARVEIADVVGLGPEAGAGGDFLALCDVVFAGPNGGAEGRERYAVVLGDRTDETGLPVLATPGGTGGGWLVESATDPATVAHLLAGFADGTARSSRDGGRIEYHDISDHARRVFGGAPPPARALGAEQSNTTVRIGREFVFKLFRRLAPGENPEVEVGRFLTNRTTFRDMPVLEGSIVWRPASGAEARGSGSARAGESCTLGVLQRWVDNEGDGWTYVCHALERLVRETGPAEPGAELPARTHTRGPLHDDLRNLGRITAEFHAALASDASDPAFRPEPMSPADIDAWSADLRRQLDRTLTLIDSARGGWTGDARSLADEVLTALKDRAPLVLHTVVNGAAAAGGFRKIRIHGDFHLGQTLKTRSGLVLMDFEGEPAQPMAVRRAKTCALKDVAGMLRSFEYAIETVAAGGGPGVAQLRHLANLRTPFLDSYLASSRSLGAGVVPADPDTVMAWLRFFELSKASYEFEYELNNRPAWAPIPLRGILAALTMPHDVNDRGVE